MMKDKSEPEFTTFQQAIKIAIKFFPCSTWLSSPSWSTEVSKTFTNIGERLLQTSHPVDDKNRYCGDVVCFVYLLSDLRSRRSDSNTVKTRLTDLIDFCYGLDADDAIIGLFKEIYNEQGSPINVLAASCIASLNGGLSAAEELLFPLLKDRDEKTRLRAATAVSRALRMQGQLAQQAPSKLGWSKEDRRRLTKSVDLFQQHLLICDMPNEVREKLTKDGIVRPDIRLKERLHKPANSLDDLIAAYARDEVFFRNNRDVLLRDHLKEYVAIRNEKILGFARKLPDLYKFIDKEIGPNLRVFVNRIIPETFEEYTPSQIF
jgi:hypothetical protein